MFERYTEKARRSIFFARYEASTYGSHYIEVVHLLLGLVREAPQNFTRISGVERGALLRAIEALCTRSEDKIATSVDLPLSQAAKRVLTYASEEAERLSHRHIGTEHLLLGVLREHGPEAGVLATLGISWATAMASVGSSAAASDRGAPPAPLERQAIHDLLASVPDERLFAAARLLAGLSEEFFTASGISSQGQFNFTFGADQPGA